MKLRVCAYLLIGILAFSSCNKNELSKIPSIALTFFTQEPIKVNKDTCFLEFRLTDGDADLGQNQTGNGPYDIYVKDFRYDTGFAGYYFPAIDPVENPDKGLTGLCTFMFTPYILTPRNDSIHIALGDTTHFEVYIMDRAGNTSNHIITSDIIMEP